MDSRRGEWRNWNYPEHKLLLGSSDSGGANEQGSSFRMGSRSYMFSHTAAEASSRDFWDSPKDYSSNSKAFSYPQPTPISMEIPDDFNEQEVQNAETGTRPKKTNKEPKKSSHVASKALRPKQPKKKPDVSTKKIEKSGKREKKDQDFVFDGTTIDLSQIPAPGCSCTGVLRQCYRWGVGGWQSSCCTISISEYPLPMSSTRPGSRLAGRKMSNGAYGKLLQRLVAEGYDLSNAIDLKEHWARHGTNKFVTIK